MIERPDGAEEVTHAVMAAVAAVGRKGGTVNANAMLFGIIDAAAFFASDAPDAETIGGRRRLVDMMRDLLKERIAIFQAARSKQIVKARPPLVITTH